MSISEYVTGLVLSSIATSSVGLVAMLILAGAVFRLDLLLYGLAAFPFVAVLFLFGIALGIMASALVMRLGPSAEWFIWPIPALISPFAGVFYPLEVLPQWMQVVAHCLPPAYVFENLRLLVKGGAVSAQELVAGTLLAIGYIILASFIFSRTYRMVVRTGLIARYSAESIS
jgi:ABC-2 type transport system permease protein